MKILISQTPRITKPTCFHSGSDINTILMVLGVLIYIVCSEMKCWI
jgi:hypothetical protein